MKFQTLALVKHPLPRVWNVMRDELPQLADHLDDIESITTTERTDAPGEVSIVNIWRAKPKLPEMLARHVDTTKLAWIDRGVWHEASKTCRWRIEPQVFSSYFDSCGETRFEPAMGGRGTRITFSGEAEIKIGKVSDGVRKVLEDTLFMGAISLVQGIISRNLRKMADALGAHLDAEVRAASSPLPGSAIPFPDGHGKLRSATEARAAQFRQETSWQTKTMQKRPPRVHQTSRIHFI